MGRQMVSFTFFYLIFQSYGYALAYLKMHNTSLPHLCPCLWMHVHDVAHSWLILLQLPAVHMQLLVSVQQMHTCIFISQAL